MSEADARLFKTLRTYCAISATIAVALGFVVLCGWAFQIDTLKSVVPGFVTMKPNTALGLALSGISLRLLLPDMPSSLRRYVGRFLAFAVTLLAVATLCEYLFGFNLRIDQLLFHEVIGTVATSSPGRMSPTTATAFLTIGSALLLLDRRKIAGNAAAQVLSLWAVLMAILAITGYAYHATALYRILLYTQVALHTAIGLLLLSTAIFFARPRVGIAGDLTGLGLGSVMARRLLPAIVFVPIFLGWISLKGQFAGLYGTEMRLALYATSNIVVFAILVWLSARKLNVEHKQRGIAEVAIRELNSDLEHRVVERTKSLERQTAALAQQAALLDLAHEAIVVRDMQNCILFWNRGAEIMYGWPSDLAVGRIQYELLKSELPLPLAEIEAELLATGHWEGETVHHTRDGARLNIGSRWALQRDAAGEPLRILSINTDITKRKRAEARDQFLTQRLSLATAVAEIGVWEWDLAGKSMTWDDTITKIYGFSLGDQPYEQWRAAVHPDDLQAAEGALQKVIKEKGKGSVEFRIIRADGSIRHLSAAEGVLLDEFGNVSRVVGVNMDVTERRAAEEALFEEKERAQVTLNSIGDAVICTDISGDITFLNVVAENMTGWSSQESAGRPMAEVFRILDGSTRETLPDPMQLAIGQDRTMNLPLNCLLIRRDGVETPIEDSVSPIHDRKGVATGAVIVFRDVSVAQTMALQMAHSAQHDFLTGLPNRMLLNDRANQAIALASRQMKKVAVLFLDLDGFKHINDSLGHPIGDLLLQSIAKRLGDCVRASDTVSRQGGDEFVVLLSEIERAEDAAITARRMLQAVAEAHSIDHHDLHVSTSIGVSVYPDDGLDAETLIKNADTAMYQAKENGRQSYQFFRPAMNVRAVERQSIEEGLRRALERQEFTVHYQPKVSLATGEITGAEALIRWMHPTRGMVPPADFIPVAEDCGLILPIGRWVLRQACAQAQAWVAAGLAPIAMAVNISAMEFRDDGFLGFVFAALQDAGLDPRSLELEITESVLMKRADSTESVLKSLRAQGVRVAIDDFGTGYSSLSYLRKFPLDTLKIDQSFVRQITTTPHDTAIVTAVISMGRSLKLKVVAEGVETEEELAFLRAHRCDEAQGYYFSRPVPANQFAGLLKKGISEMARR